MKQKYEIDYFHCKKCQFLQTEEPYWLEEAYRIPINVSDTGIIQRNIWLARVSAVLIYTLFDKNSSFVDFAGGYGLLVRLMRDIGFDFYWNDKYADFFFARGFTIDEIKKRAEGFSIELVTSFESFEHFADPAFEFKNILNTSKNLLLTTEILPDPIPSPKNWWYYGLEHGQHVSFYRLQSLQYLASQYNLFFNSNGTNIQLFSKKRIPPFKFKLLCKLSKYLFIFVQGQMVSKTVTDMEKIIETEKF